jgi:hypothetical protein
MGNKESKKNSDTITPANQSGKEHSANNIKAKKTKKQKEPKDKQKVNSEEASHVSIPVDINATLKNKEFLNDLSLFIVKAYDTNFQGTFNEFMVI